MSGGISEFESQLRKDIHQLISKIVEHREKTYRFVPGETMVRYGGAVYDAEELSIMVDAILDGWFSGGKYTLRFEAEFSRFLGVRKAISVNSGSSANLLALASLFSNQLPEEMRLKPGDEVITTAMCFPTTLNPLIIYNLKPVLVDVEIGTYNPNPEIIEKAVSEKTRAIFITHTLGNPNDMKYLMDIAESHNLILLEDACDALGSKYNGKYVGTFGHLGTFSFYPPHHITTGEGGMVVTNDELLGKIVRSLRDWGRACTIPICDPMRCPDKECPRSLKSDVKNIYGLPEDYDKRYTYVNVGFNLKITEIQAAMGIAQMKKLSRFIELRKRNFKILYEELSKYDDFFILPEWHPKSDPSWFAFPLTIRRAAPFNRRKIMGWLLRNRIEAKLLFAGNILKHPAYRNLNARIYGSLDNTDYIMYNSFFIGVYPGLTEEMLNYVVGKIKEFVSSYKI